jgi:tetratricopeptide (TPR) repeat protein
MARSITQYRIFIATPGGLDDERNAFRKTLEAYTASDAEPRGVTFHPVGWEETLGGAGRPQGLINEDLRQCDYAVFVWHDRWGSPTGNGTMVGTEEEWKLAEELYKTLQVRNIAVFFKNVDERQLRDPGEQLKQVLAHKKNMAEGKRYLFKSYDQAGAFCDELRKHLAQWLRDHEKGAGGKATAGLGSAYELMESTEGPDVARLSGAVGSGLATADGPTIASPAPSLAMSDARPPNFRFWIEETNQLLNADAAETATYSDALFCARKALASGATDLERAEAKFVLGKCQTRLNRPADVLATLSEIATASVSAGDTDWLAIQAKALVSKAVTLGQLGRSEEALSVYDDVTTRFGTADELALREPVARALVNKGVTLSRIGRGEEAIAVYDDVIARFGAAGELALCEGVARALVNKGLTLGRIGRGGEAIAVYDDVIARFGAAGELALREGVARALFAKGLTLSRIGRGEEAIAVYDDLIARFGAAGESALREQVARALFAKGFTFGQLGRSEDAIAAYDDVIARFGAASELALRKQVANALVYKGVKLGQLGRSEDAIAAYDDVIARFGADDNPALKAIVQKAGTSRSTHGSSTESQ